MFAAKGYSVVVAEKAIAWAASYASAAIVAQLTNGTVFYGKG